MKLLFYPFTVNLSTCSGSCNTIDDPYAWLCVPNEFKNINAKVFNSVSRVNEIRFLVQHESCGCKCRLNEIVRNVKQKQKRDECRCECKELDDCSSCEKDYMWNPSTCNSECNKACKIDEYLDVKDCSCEIRLIGKLVFEYENEKLNVTETSLDDKK